MYPKASSLAQLMQCLPYEMQIPTSGEVEKVDRTEALALRFAMLCVVELGRMHVSHG
jgi:hypothetical protein